MRALFPHSREVTADDLPALYGRTDGVRLNMVASADGSATAGGRSGGLGGRADKQVFATLRTLADAILVGAGTVRAEQYGPVRFSDAVRARRRQAGLAEIPPIALVTASAGLDWSRPFFTEAEVRPIVITVNGAPADNLALAHDAADVIMAGDTDVDLVNAVAQLRARGFTSILAEGGPTLGGQLTAVGLLDELCLTLSPKLIGGDGPRILNGPVLPEPTQLDLVHLLEEDGFLFLRYRKAAMRG